MRIALPATVLLSCLAASPAAIAGDFFANGQVGRMDLDSDGFDGDETSLMQGSVGYRWGIGMAQVGLEAGIGKLGGLEDGTRQEMAGGSIETRYTLASRYAFAGLNARIKPPLAPVYAIARAGYVGFRHDFDATAVTTLPGASPVTTHRNASSNDGGTYLGVGVGTTLLPLLDVGLVLDQYRVEQVRYDAAEDEYMLSDDKRSARSLSLTVEYRF